LEALRLATSILSFLKVFQAQSEIDNLSLQKVILRMFNFKVYIF